MDHTACTNNPKENKSVAWLETNSQCGKIGTNDVACVGYWENNDLKLGFCNSKKADEPCSDVSSSCKCGDKKGDHWYEDYSHNYKFISGEVRDQYADPNAANYRPPGCNYDSTKIKCLQTQGVIKKWEDYLNAVESAKDKVKNMEKKAKKINCVFIRAVVEHPKPPKPPTVCQEATTMAAKLIDSAHITWVETPTQATYVTFLEQAAEISANAICAHTPRWKYSTPPPQHSDNFGLTEAFVTMQCTGKAVETAACNVLGDQMTGFLNHVLVHMNGVWNSTESSDPEICYDKSGIWPAKNRNKDAFTKRETAQQDLAENLVIDPVELSDGYYNFEGWATAAAPGIRTYMTNTENLSAEKFFEKTVKMP
jgi:hypothetical protein